MLETGRLTAPPESREPFRAGELPPVRFRRLGREYLLTNDAGNHAFLDEPRFKRLLAGKLPETDERYGELKAKGFIRAQIDFQALASAYVKRNSFRWTSGPSLHMIVVTLRCNQKCLYCHSSVVDPSRTDTDMDLDTAKRTVDFIFRTPNPTICIEFQGGEPLLNWPVVKFITLYARAKAKAENRRLIIALVSNFTLMNEERLDFFLDNHVSLCTSLDGPSEVHDRNRPFLGAGLAQEKVVAWMEKLQKLCREQHEERYYLPAALMTTTRFSFGHAKEIVDLYVRLGLDQIFVRPLSPIGYAKRVWGEIGYEPKDFLKFYDEALDYILWLNRDKDSIMERMALVLLTKIVKGEDPGFMDLRSPSGAALGCLAYNYNGEIFVSDEGRMVDHQGDPLFRIGRVEDEWAKVLEHPTAAACVTASTLDNQPMCSQCAYYPYCGAEPVFHYEMQRSVFGQMPSSPWCVGHMGVFDAIFRRLQEPRARAVFERWLARDQCRWEERKPGEEAAAGSQK